MVVLQRVSISQTRNKREYYSWLFSLLFALVLVPSLTTKQSKSPCWKGPSDIAKEPKRKCEKIIARFAEVRCTDTSDLGSPRWRDHAWLAGLSSRTLFKPPRPSIQLSRLRQPLSGLQDLPNALPNCHSTPYLHRSLHLGSRVNS